MAKEIEDDERLGTLLGCGPQEVTIARSMWQKNRIMRKVHEDAIDRQIEERRTQLETVSLELLRSIQGEIKGLRAARGIVLKAEK